jgi:hypothetical protein
MGALRLDLNRLNSILSETQDSFLTELTKDTKETASQIEKLTTRTTHLEIGFQSFKGY